MNTVGARLIFANARKALKNAGIDPTGKKLTQSFLRLERAIVVGTTQYLFPVLNNQSALGIFATEQRMNMQDSFVLSTIGVYTAVPASANDTAFLPLTYPNTLLYATAGAAAATKAIYNGTLQVQVNGNILIPAWDLLKHYVSPITNQTAAVNSPVDQVDFGHDGVYPVEPNITVRGDKNTQISVNLPGTGVATIQANSRIIIVMRGVLAQNTTSVS
jgi:hypothetical protein